MYVKIQPKFDDASPLAAYGYELMTDAFDNLVFAGNLDGYSAGGSYCVIKIGGIFEEDGLDMLRECIMDIWNKEDYRFQPDEILSIAICDSILG